MNFISTIKAERLIAQIRGEANIASPSAKKAFDKLRQIGPAAVPKIPWRWVARINGKPPNLSTFSPS